MNYKMSLDFHGVIDRYPKIFSWLTKLLYAFGCEIHIVTGNSINHELLTQLSDFGISYTHMFSIIDYHEKIGTAVQYDERGPWIDADLWNRTKAEYCESNKIALHIDDSDVYGQYFTSTIYLYLANKK